MEPSVNYETILHNAVFELISFGTAVWLLNFGATWVLLALVLLTTSLVLLASNDMGLGFSCLALSVIFVLIGYGLLSSIGERRRQSRPERPGKVPRQAA
jgi:hypothetical protein